MLWFFTDFYPDELFYSAVARYHYYSGNNGYRHTINELFGDENVTANILLPRNLTYFEHELDSKIYTISNIIANHTILPYYLPFIPQDMQKTVLEGITNEDLVGLYTKIGLAASDICGKDSLYYCPICSNDDIELYGESYFRRLHQVPGINICETHMCFLEVYPNSHIKAHKNQFIRLNSDEIAKEAKKVVTVSSLEINYIRAVKMLLNNDMTECSLESLKEKYKYFLGVNGYITAHGRIRRQKLLDNVISFYSNDLLSEFESIIWEDSYETWLDHLIHKKMRFVHPIRQIIFILYITENIKEFIEHEKQEYFPFGKGPWPCLNPVSNHFKRKVVKHCDISQAEDRNKVIGTFYCNCGFVYSRSGPDSLKDDVYKIGRIKRFGHIWMEKLQETLDRNLGLRETARIMKCDPKTIKKYSNVEDEKSKYQICKVKTTSPKVEQIIDKPNKDLRNKYMRVNWSVRDKIILAEVKKAYVEVLKADKLTRVTKRQIALRTNYFGLIDDQLQKLPLTMNYINLVKEDYKAFKIRKAKIVCREYVKNNKMFRPWEVYKAVNLKEGDSKEIDDIVIKYYKELYL